MGQAKRHYVPRRPLRRSLRSWLRSGALQALSDEANDILFRYRLLPAPRMEYISPAVENILGYTPQEFEQDSELFILAMHPRDREKLEQLIASDETRGTQILRYRHRSGRMIWMQMHLYLTKDENGQVQLLEGLARDISDKMWAESLLARFLNASQVAILIAHQQDGRILSVNEGFLRMFGFRRGEVMGKSLYLLDIWPNNEERQRLTDLFTLQSYMQSMEMDLKTSSGRAITVLASLESIEYNGQACVLAIASDISEQHRSREALGRSEARFRRLFEDATLGIFQSTQGGKLLHANPAFVEMFGYNSLEEMLRIDNISKQIYVNPADRERIVEQNINTQGGIQAELEFRRKDGNLFTGRVYSWTVQEQTDGPIYLEGFIEDITEQRKAEQTERKQRALAEALRLTGEALTSSFSLDQVLDTILQGLEKVVPHDAANIMLVEEGRARVVRWQKYERYVTNVGRTFKMIFEVQEVPNFRRAAESHRPILVSDTQHSERWREFSTTAWIRSNILAPIEMENHLIGFISIDSATPGFFTEEHIRPLQMFVYQAAIAIHRVQLFEDLQRSNEELSRAYEATLEGWAMALELRDPDTRIHTRRVTELTHRLAVQIGVPEKDLVHFRQGAILHDIGKMGVRDEILQKKGSLDEKEMDEMRKHPTYAFRMLSGIPHLQRALDIPYSHHEKWDGTGYPRGLKGEEIPLAARIFAIIDVWDALTHDRVYRPAWDEAAATQYLREQSGKHFDPMLVDVFIKMIGKQ